MKKTRYCAVLAAGVLAAALATGCGSKKAEATTSAVTTAAESAPDNGETDAAMEVNEINESEFEEGDLKIPTGNVEVERKNADGTVLVEGYYEQVVIPDSLKDKPIGKALEAFNQAQIERARTDIAYLESEAEKNLKDKGDKFKAFEYNSDVSFSTQNQDYVSIQASSYSKTDAEEKTVYHTATYDTKTGNELKVSDIVAEPDKLADALADRLLHENSKEDFGDVDVKGKIKEMITNGTLAWNLEDDGAVFTFAEGTVAPVDNGEFTVKYLYAFTPEFFKSVPEAAMKAAQEGAEILDDGNDAADSKSAENSDEGASGPGKEAKPAQESIAAKKK